jgi:16S rRNA (guanine(527)-N(7))-methyltransferase RsmG
MARSSQRSAVPAALSSAVIKAELSAYGVIALDELCDQVRQYVALLLRWNTKISLTAVTDPLEVLRFHFGESMFAASVVPMRSGRLADVGSGAGFPGVPLKLIEPALEVTLIEPNAKKAAFLGEVIRELDLKNTNILRERIEAATSQSASYQSVCCRAVGHLSDVIAWARSSLCERGSIVLWTTPETASSVVKMDGFEWHEPVPIPRTKRRVLLAGFRG